MRKPNWQSVDWMELGCRGWDIELTGAGLGEDGECDWQYAHLDRETLALVMSGRPAFIARAINDLRAAGLLRIQEETAGNIEWAVNLGAPSWFAGTTLTGNTTGNPRVLKLIA